MKKPIAIVFSLAAILLCGIPGILILVGKLEGEYIYDVYFCGGILILIPIVIAIASFANIDGNLKEVITTGCITITSLVLVSPLILLLVGVFIPEGLLAIQKSAWRREHKALTTELGVVCQGIAVPSAAEFESSNGFHPIIFIDENGETDGMSIDLPDDWVPADVSSAEIVACFERFWKAIERCEYTGGPPITRYKEQLTIRLFAAHTGEKINDQVFFGTPPEECPTLANTAETTMYGGSVLFSDIQPWLAGIIQE